MGAVGGLKELLNGLLNGRIDLVQAEAIIDVIRSNTNRFGIYRPSIEGAFRRKSTISKRIVTLAASASGGGFSEMI